MKLNFDVVIIGCGCAGITAAIYLKRANKNVLIIEKNVPGGKINKSSRIDNYPGFIGIDGPTLASNMYEQIQQLKIPYKQGEVTSIIDYKDHKVVMLDDEKITCKAVIIATGRRSKELGLEKEKELAGKGISWCSICDAPLFKGKDIIVVSGGNSALEESLHLAEYVNKVTLIHRQDKFIGDEILQEKVLNNDKINIIYDSIITKIKEKDGYFSGVEIKNIKTKEKKEIESSGLFVYAGFEPITNIFKELGLNTEDGYIVVDQNMRTNVKGIYACGDVIKKDLYQITTAIGEGAKAAFSVIQDLNEDK